MPDKTIERLGAVVIGRNEGERLRRCLESLSSEAATLVYVDSGSTDDSVALASELGAQVVCLDSTVPFTAGRARNAGFERLMAIDPGLEFVAFVDGDCELAPGWLEAARLALESDTRLAAVCGRLRERRPEQSIYNRLCDLEWDAPAGETEACGGNAVMRSRAVRQAGGFRDDLIAGEEPELCLRLRREGFTIRRLDAEMGWHDADLLHFSQWWRRSVRAGYAYAHGAMLHGRSSERHYVRQRRSNFLLGCALPVAALALAPISRGWSLAALSIYPLMTARIAIRRKMLFGGSLRLAAMYALFCMLGKFPQALGQARFRWGQWRGRPASLIEHKVAATAQTHVRSPRACR